MPWFAWSRPTLVRRRADPSQWVAELGSRYGLRFAGIVEVGFSEADCAKLGRRLAPLQQPSTTPWRSHRGQPVCGTRPELRVEVQFLEWTDQGRARHLSYKGISGASR